VTTVSFTPRFSEVAGDATTRLSRFNGLRETVETVSQSLTRLSDTLLKQGVNDISLRSLKTEC
jgi:hypothetical protein